MARLIIPDDFASQLTLLTNISAQNTALGANSPITSFLTQQGIVQITRESKSKTRGMIMIPPGN